MIERKIIIGLIVCTEYYQRVKDIWDVTLLDSATAKRIATWCWEYYTMYGVAPNRDIEAIYYTKLKENKLPKDLAEEIEQDILPSLSDEYSNTTFNLEYLFAETTKYFTAQRLKALATNVQDMVRTGMVDDATATIKDFTPCINPADVLNAHINTVEGIRSKNHKKPLMFMYPWLRSGQLTILYGNYGTGKSLLAITIAYLLGLKQRDDNIIEIGEWYVKNPTGTLYIDGELGEIEMEERMSSFEYLGNQRYKMKILSVPEYQLATERQFDLSDRADQTKIIQWLHRHPRYKLVILDSVSTLFNLTEENNNSEWNSKINPFLRDLRALGVACLLLHHAGKDNKRGLRGASAMGAMAHNIFRLTGHDKYDVDDGEAWFTLSKDKQRSGGKCFKKFSLHFYQEGSQTHWEITANN